MRFVRRAVPLAVVARKAGAHQVFPLIDAAAGAGYHMVYREWRRRCAAVLTSVVIASEHILARQIDLLVGDADVGRQAYHGWKREHGSDGPDSVIGAFLDDLGLGQHYQEHGLLCGANAYGFVGLVEYQNAGVQRRRCGRYGKRRGSS